MHSNDAAEAVFERMAFDLYASTPMTTGAKFQKESDLSQQEQTVWARLESEPFSFE